MKFKYQTFYQKIKSKSKENSICSDFFYNVYTAIFLFQSSRNFNYFIDETKEIFLCNLL